MTNKQQLYFENLEKRVAAMEIVFSQGSGKNYIWDNLLNKIEAEVRFDMLK